MQWAGASRLVETRSWAGLRRRGQTPLSLLIFSPTRLSTVPDRRRRLLSTDTASHLTATNVATLNSVVLKNCSSNSVKWSSAKGTDTAATIARCQLIAVVVLPIHLVHYDVLFVTSYSLCVHIISSSLSSYFWCVCNNIKYIQYSTASTSTRWHFAFAAMLSLQRNPCTDCKSAH